MLDHNVIFPYQDIFRQYEFTQSRQEVDDQTKQCRSGVPTLRSGSHRQADRRREGRHLHQPHL